MNDSNSKSQTETVLLLVPAGKLRCYVHTDILRQDTPEEHVRQRVSRSLVEEYGYDKRDMHLEFPITMGSGKKKRIDIAIFSPGAEHRQEHIVIIVEAKREDVTPTDRAQGVEQLKSYLAACKNARWGLWVGKEMRALEVETDAKKAAREPFLDSTDIPLKGDTEPKRLEFADLVPATAGLRHVFARCHDYLHVNGNLGKEKAFFELLKLIFCKLYDEQHTTGILEFSVSVDERRSELGQRKLKQRIAGIFGKVREEYPYIFPQKGEAIELDNRSLSYTVAELQKFSLMQTASDIKGEAYEEIVSVTSRRDHGAFFTPRNVCDLAVGMVLATYRPEQRLKLRILDPCCGTGGFLRAALLHLKEIIHGQQEKKWKANKEKAEEQTTKLLREYCNKQIFGIDKLPELVRAAQMNLALHGDGSANVFWENSLLMPGEWKADTRAHVELAAFDVVFTNPPFGSKLPVDDPHILDRYDLTKYEAKAPRSSLPPEQLFVQRCLDLLKPGGRMAIVLPDSILSNPGLAWLRRWVLREAWVLASVDLPREMFARSDTHTMTSVLILQRFTREERAYVQKVGHPDEYEIFMAIAEKVGWDLRGQPVYRRTPEGAEILEKRKRLVSRRDAHGHVVEEEVEVEEPIIDDQLPTVTELFENWLKTRAPFAWQND
jgi:type I restriction enzyme M protein